MIGHLQESLITLLSLDAQHAPIIRGLVDINLFGGPYRLLSSRIYDYLDRFHKPPGDHLPDLCQDKLEKQSSEAGFYADLIANIHGSYAGLNAAYVMSQLEVFIKRQSLRGIAVDLNKALQRDTEESLLEAEALLASANRQTLSVFDPGTRLSDKNRALRFLDQQEAAFPTGIPELDHRGFGPTRRELWLGIGNTGSGKTWLLIQLAKMALMHRVKVSHITLEVSEEKCAQRYFQALFSISKRGESFQTSKFKKDQLGRVTGIEDHRATPKRHLDHPKIRATLEGLISKWGTRLLERVIIRQFPTGDLTVGALKAYLDNLEATQRFVPDLLIIDYPDLMAIPGDDYRLGLDLIFKQLRGIAVARNLALAVVSQSHRSASKAKQVGADNVAEAYSKAFTADTIITYSQTMAEQALGLARLHVAKGRNDSDKYTIVISQLYATGKFVVDSAMMQSNYWQHVPQQVEE